MFRTSLLDISLSYDFSFGQLEFPDKLLDGYKSHVSNYTGDERCGVVFVFHIKILP